MTGIPGGDHVEPPRLTKKSVRSLMGVPKTQGTSLSAKQVLGRPISIWATPQGVALSSAKESFLSSNL